MQRVRQALQVGFTYIGTVVGAGFASGQEILKFFTLFGEYSTAAILVSTLLFAWVGNRILLLGARLRANSYRQLTAYLFGERLAAVIDLFMLIMLFGVTVAMLAGVGALFQEHLKIPFQIGVLLTMILTYFTILRGMNGILTANSIIVPMMIALISFICLKTLFETSHPLPRIPASPSWSWLASAVSYAAFNAGLAVSVLVPLGNEIQDKRSLIAGGLIGATGLGGMLLAANYAMSVRMPEILDYQVPMAFITSTYGPVLQVLFIVVLWGEIFSTLIANVFGISSQLSDPLQTASGSLVTVSILTSAFFASQIGFKNIVAYLYPIFGYISFLLLIMLIWPRSSLKPPVK
jgi:uncharacterized membrane protein YkvI